MILSLKSFTSFVLIVSIFCTVPNVQAFNMNAATLDKVLSAPVQKLWPHAVAFVAAGTVGAFVGATIAYQKLDPVCDIRRGLLWSRITLALLKMAHYCPGDTVPKLVALTIIPIFAVSLGDGGKMCFTSCVSSIAAVAAANYVK